MIVGRSDVSVAEEGMWHEVGDGCRGKHQRQRRRRRFVAKRRAGGGHVVGGARRPPPAPLLVAPPARFYLYRLYQYQSASRRHGMRWCILRSRARTASGRPL